MTLPARAALALACLLISAPSSWAQGKRPITGEGTEGFRALLAAEKLQPLVNREDLKLDPGHTLLVCFRGADALGRSYPDQIGNLDFDIKSEFVDRGGALMFASDQTLMNGRNLWNQSFGFQIHGAIQGAIDDQLDLCYRGLQECPVLHRVRGSSPDLFKAAANTTGRDEPLSRVATNRPTFLIRASDLDLIAVLLPLC